MISSTYGCCWCFLNLLDNQHVQYGRIDFLEMNIELLRFLQYSEIIKPSTELKFNNFDMSKLTNTAICYGSTNGLTLEL